MGKDKEDKKFLGKEFNKVKYERTMRQAGIVTEQAIIDTNIDKLRKEGKLHPILDVYDPETNKRLAKELWEDDDAEDDNI